MVRQLMHSRLMMPYAPEDWGIICTTDINIKNSLVIVHKSIFNSPNIMQALKAQGNTIVADVIDGVITDVTDIDAILCCSHKAVAFYTAAQNKCPVFFVEHCCDIRVLEQEETPSTFSPFYFGASENLLVYNSIFEFIRPCFTNYYDQQMNWVDYLKLANFHYALRCKIDPRSFKPFMKGIIASFCNSNILVHASDGDAARYLGQDYPYLIKEPLTEQVVLHYLAKAKDDFGGKTWNSGLAVMRDMKELFRPATIAAQFWTMVRRLGD
ncbi:conserved hypothetical protein [uncultured delta proteobacterium]|uniref:Uncharacterized protein n=1 Tax=uncultured delta proteobacterium TaxID=34034 RepID=A0A212JGZ4_9DELT|nr:conserved hypothetical protein [uncultured delta proteobacterium]